MTVHQLTAGVKPAPAVHPRADDASAGPAVIVRGLSKRYGSFTAVDGLDLTIPAGEVYALLGPNGAGKTTTVEILQGFRTRDAGEVSVLGADPAADGRHWRARIGVVPQSTGAYDDLTVREVIRHFAAFYAAPLPPDQVIEMVGLTGKARARATSLSGGQQRRLDVAVGVVGDPDLIFLDEPTTGLDPVARREAWDLVRFFAARGATTVLTTHYLDEAQALATRAAVIAAGRVIDEGPVADIGRAASVSSLVTFRRPVSGQVPVPGIEAFPGFRPTPGDPGLVTIDTASPTDTLRALLTWADRWGVAELPELRVHRPTLEECYLALVAAHTSPESS